MSETLTPPPQVHTQAAQPQAPWPGSHDMPHWNLGPLVDAPRFTWKNWFAMLGPGLLMGGAAIGRRRVADGAGRDRRAMAAR